MLNDKLEQLAAKDWTIDEMTSTIQSIFDQVETKGESYLILCTMLQRLKERAIRLEQIQARLEEDKMNAEIQRQKDAITLVEF